MFRIIFVLDIFNGNAVHAVRGERARYQPIKGSKICDSSNPLDMISALSPKEAYIADLDRLQHQGDNFGLIKEISEKARTMVDIGVKNMDDVEKCTEIADTVILGTETTSFDLIEKATKRFPGRINVSIDIKNGMVLTKDKRMEIKPQELVKLMEGQEVRDIIILELSKVGTSVGIDGIFLKEIIRASSHNILVGGGIKDLNNIEVLKKIGAGGALVATALHDGKIPVQLIR
jgi:phosphoribosylformimino-5-aminoimidazole carboxamide ribotide isomerase